MSNITKKDFFVASSDGVHKLAGKIYMPKTDVKGFFQIVHGMTEHIARYDRIMTDLAEAGYLCFGYDQVGHGYTARDDGELGFIAHKNGHELLAKDVKQFSDAVFSEYGKTPDTPYILMGHSMGSFVVRYSTSRYVNPDKLIIMGTAGANPAADAGLMLISVIKALKGEKHFSPLIDGIAFGSYNKRFGGGSAEDPKPWLTNDEEIRKIYYADRFCSFKFSVSAMGDLIRLIKYANRSSCYKNTPKEMPVLLVSGTEDPVGNYGKGVTEVHKKLVRSGHDSKMVLYPDARHEILNDHCYAEVKKNILDFIDGKK